MLDWVAEWITEAISNLITYVYGPVFEFLATPLQFDFVSDAITVMQAIAVGLILIIRIANGITKGIILTGCDEDQDALAYLWGTAMPLAVVAAAPALADIATRAVTSFVSSIAGGASALDGFAAGMGTSLSNYASGSYEGSVLVAAIGGIALFVTIGGLAIDILKRWVQLAMCSFIMPLSAVMLATDDSTDIKMVLKTYAGIAVTIVLQILVLNVACATWAAGDIFDSFVVQMFVVIALVSAARALPAWIDKFTYAGNVQSRGGAVMKTLYGARAISQIVRRG